MLWPLASWSEPRTGDGAACGIGAEAVRPSSLSPGRFPACPAGSSGSISHSVKRKRRNYGDAFAEAAPSATRGGSRARPTGSTWSPLCAPEAAPASLPSLPFWLLTPDPFSPSPFQLAPVPPRIPPAMSRRDAATDDRSYFGQAHAPLKQSGCDLPTSIRAPRGFLMVSRVLSRKLHQQVVC